MKAGTLTFARMLTVMEGNMEAAKALALAVAAIRDCRHDLVGAFLDMAESGIGKAIVAHDVLLLEHQREVAAARSGVTKSAGGSSEPEIEIPHGFEPVGGDE